MSERQTYWNCKAPFWPLLEDLSKDIPPQGECPAERPALEALRRAQNAYYDLFNNGGCNRERDIRRIFGLPRGLWAGYQDELRDELFDRTEPQMDALVLAAAEERWPVVDLAKKVVLTVLSGNQPCPTEVEARRLVRWCAEGEGEGGVWTRERPRDQCLRAMVRLGSGDPWKSSVVWHAGRRMGPDEWDAELRYFDRHGEPHRVDDAPPETMWKLLS